MPNFYRSPAGFGAELLRRSAQIVMLSAIAVGNAGALGAQAQQLGTRDKPAGNSVLFDHSSCRASEPSDACAVQLSRTLTNGAILEVVISGTDTSRFDYAIAGVKIAAPDKAGVNADKADRHTDVRRLWVSHDKQYGGYVVTIKRRPDAGIDKAGLGDATIRIAVKTAEVQVSFASGFTVTGLVDPVYGLRTDTLPHASGTEAVSTQTFVEYKDRRDAASRGAAAFVHVWYPRGALTPFAMSFGLGIDKGHGTTYHIGPSIRFADKAFLTAGVAWGTVKTPPSGVEVNQVVTDPNVLKNLGERTDRRFFVAVSYGFLGGAEDALKKPFAGATPAAGAAGGAAAETGKPAEEAQSGSADSVLKAAIPGSGTATDVEIKDKVMLVVMLTKNDAPVSGATITWKSANATVKVAKATSATDGTGKASIEVTGTGTPDASWKVTASVGPGAGHSVTFTFKP